MEIVEDLPNISTNNQYYIIAQSHDKNNIDRYSLRGELLIEAAGDTEIRITADYD